MHLHIQKDTNLLSHELAEWIIADIKRILKEKNRYTLVLSGGNSPKELYRLLATEPYRSQINWENIHLFWGDERYVPFEDKRNNGKMAYDTLLQYVPVPKEQIHYMDTTMEPERSAEEYEKVLHQYFDDHSTTFDLVLLGMGDDGHTLSLFPRTSIIHEQQAWVAAPYVKEQEMYRITLTTPVVNKSATIAFLVVGEGKAETLREVIKGAYRPDIYPSQIIQPKDGNLHWFADEQAASLLQ